MGMEIRKEHREVGELVDRAVDDPRRGPKGVGRQAMVMEDCPEDAADDVSGRSKRAVRSGGVAPPTVANQLRHVEIADDRDEQRAKQTQAERPIPPELALRLEQGLKRVRDK